MEENAILREQIFEIVSNQIKNDNPPETKLTYDRLIEDGFNDFEVRQMIGSCVAIEIFNVFKSGKPYDDERYIRNLKKLPEEPFE